MICARINTIMRIYLLLALVASACCSLIRKDDTIDLLILHNNDMHARFEQTSQLSGVCNTADREAGKCYGGFPRVAHVVKEAREAARNGSGPPVLYLNAGDTYTGTAWFTIYKWKIAAECINALQPDAVSLGNHEFDNGVSGLTPFIEALNTPVLACNLDLKKVPTLLYEPNLRKSVVFTINGVNVGVIGYLTPDTKFLAIRNDVEYEEEVVAIRREAAKLKGIGVNILIALGHSGFTKDLEIAEKCEDIDLVIGGHTNTFLWNGTSPDAEKIDGPYPTLVRQASGRIVPAVQAYAYTKYLGKLHLTFDSKGELVSFAGQPILLNQSVPQDPEVLKLISQYRDSVLNVSQEIVGNSSVILDGQSCRLKECNMGNLITDAMVHNYASNYKGKGWSDLSIAILQGGGIRASIAHANNSTEITKGDLMTVMPFDGNMVKIKINGTLLKRIMEHAVAAYRTTRPLGQFLQMSGMRVTYDLKKQPNNRVVSLSVKCTECSIPKFEPYDENKEYQILMTNYLALGGDGFTMFDGVPLESFTYSELDCTIRYFKLSSPIIHGVEDRIIIKNASTVITYSIILMVFAILTGQLHFL